MPVWSVLIKRVKSEKTVEENVRWNVMGSWWREGQRQWRLRER